MTQDNKDTYLLIYLLHIAAIRRTGRRTAVKYDISAEGLGIVAAVVSASRRRGWSDGSGIGGWSAAEVS